MVEGVPMEYRVTLTIARPAVADREVLAASLEQATDALHRLAPDAGVVLDARAGEPNANVTLTVDAPDVADAVSQATRLLAAALLPIAGVAVEPAGS